MQHLAEGRRIVNVAEGLEIVTVYEACLPLFIREAVTEIENEACFPPAPLPQTSIIPFRHQPPREREGAPAIGHPSPAP